MGALKGGEFLYESCPDQQSQILKSNWVFSLWMWSSFWCIQAILSLNWTATNMLPYCSILMIDNYLLNECPFCWTDSLFMDFKGYYHKDQLMKWGCTKTLPIFILAFYIVFSLFKNGSRISFQEGQNFPVSKSGEISIF